MVKERVRFHGIRRFVDKLRNPYQPSSARFDRIWAYFTAVDLLRDFGENEYIESVERLYISTPKVQLRDHKGLFWVRTEAKKVDRMRSPRLRVEVMTTDKEGSDEKLLELRRRGVVKNQKGEYVKNLYSSEELKLLLIKIEARTKLDHKNRSQV